MVVSTNVRYAIILEINWHFVCPFYWNLNSWVFNFNLSLQTKSIDIIFFVSKKVSTLTQMPKCLTKKIKHFFLSLLRFLSTWQERIENPRLSGLEFCNFFNFLPSLGLMMGKYCRFVIFHNPSLVLTKWFNTRPWYGIKKWYLNDVSSPLPSNFWATLLAWCIVLIHSHVAPWCWC